MCSKVERDLESRKFVSDSNLNSASIAAAQNNMTIKLNKARLSRPLMKVGTQPSMHCMIKGEFHDP